MCCPVGRYRVVALLTALRWLIVSSMSGLARPQQDGLIATPYGGKSS